MALPRGNLFIPGPAGQIECLVQEAAGAWRWAVISHGHPQHGGILYFKVLHRTAGVLQEAGFNALRYHFRGVGNSEGSFDGGSGEADDLRGVTDYLERQRGSTGFLLAGFSFGAWISARVGCADPRVEQLLYLGLAGRLIELDFLRRCDKLTAVVQGDRDQFGEWSKVEALVKSMPRARLFRVPEADHFFGGKLEELETALREAVRFLTGSSSSGVVPTDNAS